MKCVEFLINHLSGDEAFITEGFLIRMGNALLKKRPANMTEEEFAQTPLAEKFIRIGHKWLERQVIKQRS